MVNKIIEFIKLNKIKVIIIIVIILFLIGLFILGKTSGGKDINYIPL